MPKIRDGQNIGPVIGTPSASSVAFGTGYASYYNMAYKHPYIYTAGVSGFGVIDVTNPASFSSYTVPQALNIRYHLIECDGYLIHTGEVNGTVYIIDITTDPSTPSLVVTDTTTFMQTLGMCRVSDTLFLVCDYDADELVLCSLDGSANIVVEDTLAVANRPVFPTEAGDQIFIRHASGNDRTVVSISGTTIVLEDTDTGIIPITHSSIVQNGYFIIGGASNVHSALIGSTTYVDTVATSSGINSWPCAYGPNKMVVNTYSGSVFSVFNTSDPTNLSLITTFTTAASQVFKLIWLKDATPNNYIAAIHQGSGIVYIIDMNA